MVPDPPSSTPPIITLSPPAAEFASSNASPLARYPSDTVHAGTFPLFDLPSSCFDEDEEEDTQVGLDQVLMGGGSFGDGLPGAQGSSAA